MFRFKKIDNCMAERGGFELPEPVKARSLSRRVNRPLCHLSACCRSTSSSYCKTTSSLPPRDHHCLAEDASNASSSELIRGLRTWKPQQLAFHPSPNDLRPCASSLISKSSLPDPQLRHRGRTSSVSPEGRLHSAVSRGDRPAACRRSIQL